jgi:MYXO-CTERM domain-containing protein
MEATTDGDVSPIFQTTKWTGTQPACPPPPDCDNPILVGGPGYDEDGNGDGDGGFNGCALGSDHEDYGFAAFLGGALAFAFAWRRKRRR